MSGERERERKTEIKTKARSGQLAYLCVDELFE